ncbi:aminodeoxychorismate/anthranilate synthase component II [Puteibacter caeruleilacunae]|nr:aminodeoxychorismate/anthranilate synthase component II [Puteibacter caeruleilacunae]
MTARILVLDNYDSFTYNLVHYLKELTGEQVDVRRNDKITLDEVANYEYILLSPGPGVPSDAGILKELIATYGSTKSIFGVCLGVQAIAEVYGGEIFNLDKVYHGIASKMTVTDDQEPIFKGLGDEFDAGRYHSWVIKEDVLPNCLVVTARDEEGMIMAVRHKEYNVRGVQFHPESVLTPKGKQMLISWLNLES